MKKNNIFLLLALVFTIVFSACSGDNLDIRHDLAGGSEIQLTPPQAQDQVLTPGLEEAYNEFKELVRKKDADGFIERFVSDNTAATSDPYIPTGAEEFIYYWGTDYIEPEDLDLWPVLEELIKLGGRYNSETNTFQVPFMFFDVPDEFKDEKITYCFVVNDKDVNLYEKKDLQSAIIAKLDYNVIYYEPEPGDWFVDMAETDLVSVRTLGGVEGYTQKKYMRRLTDWRFELHETEEGWKLKYLIDGQFSDWR